MNILFVYQADANDKSVQSGRPASVYNILEENGNYVQKLILDDTLSRFLCVLHRILLLLRLVRSNAARSDLLAQYYCLKIRRALAQRQFDAVFSPSTIPFQRKFRRPSRNEPATIACVDTLLPGFKQYYGYCAFTYHADLGRESNSLANIDFLFLPSAWAEKQANELNFKGKIFVAPFGANNQSQLAKSEVERVIEDRISRFPKIEILTIMSDWHRKNGELLLQLCNSLASEFSSICLTVIGEAKGLNPSVVPNRSSVHLNLVGKLSPTSPRDRLAMSALFKDATFFAMPSRGEAFGMALCEAASYALPTIASKNGGIAEIVIDSKNGINISSASELTLVRGYIINCVRNPGYYKEQSLASFDEYQTRLNWQTFYDHTFRRLCIPRV